MSKFTRNALFIVVALAGLGFVAYWYAPYGGHVLGEPFRGKWESESGMAVAFSSDRTATLYLPKESPQTFQYDVVSPQDWVERRNVGKASTSTEKLFPGVTHVVRLYPPEAPDDYNPSRSFFYSAESDALAIPMIAEFRRVGASKTIRPNLVEQWFLEDEHWSGSLRLGTDGRFEMRTGVPFTQTIPFELSGTWEVRGSSLELTGETFILQLEFVEQDITALRYSTPESARQIVGTFRVEEALYSPAEVSTGSANITSKIERGFAMAQPHMVPETPHYAKLYLLQEQGDSWQKVAYLGVRYDADGQDKLFVTDKTIAALTYVSATGGYCHYLYKYNAADFMRLNDPALGSSTVIRMGDSLLGTVWNSPDFSNPPGNKLYVLEPAGVRWFDLGGDTQQFYELERISDREFRILQVGSGGKRTVRRHSFPIPYQVTELTFE